MEWNRNEWQGKSKEQVEFSYKTASVSMVVVTIVLSILVAMTLFGCKSTEKIDCDAYSMVEHSR